MNQMHIKGSTYCIDTGMTYLPFYKITDTDIIMLDNMAPDMLREAVRIIDGRALIEASGGIAMDNLEAVAKSGVDIISIGALTHSAPPCDIGMDWV